MFHRRRSLSGLLAVLLALSVQLGLGASVPQPDAAAQIAAVVVLCHPLNPDSPTHAPAHLPDCLTCPLCAAVHAPASMLVADTVLPAPVALLPTQQSELPPPSRAPPARQRPPAQPRGPPIVS